MALSVENLRFLLWYHGVERKDWTTHLASWLNADVRRANALLRGEMLRPDEEEMIAKTAGIDRVELSQASLIAANRIDVLQANIRFLTDTLGFGEKKRLAVALGVHPSTISKWRSGDLRPRKAHLAALCRYFGLAQTVDLEVDRLFLAPIFVSEREQRAWVQTRVMALESPKWQTIFPALEILLAE